MQIAIRAALLWSVVISFCTADRVAVLRISGEETVPHSLEIDAAGKATLQMDDGAIEAPLRDLRSITFLGRKAASPMGSALFLSGGDLLVGDVTEADEKSVRFRSPFVQETAIPLSGIRAFRLPAEKIDDGAFREQMEREKRSDSIFVISEGKLLRVPGAFRSLDSKSLSLVWEGQEKTLPREKVYAVVLSGGAAGKGTRTGRVTLVDGSHVEGEILGLDGGALKLGLPLGTELSIDRGGLVRIDVLSDRLVFLSDLEPAKVEEVPYFNTVWPYRKDRSLDGKVIRLGGRTYDKGLGVHSRCVLSYALAGEFETFSAVIGIDDETKGLGHVVFRVRADGETLFDSGGMGGKDEPRRIKVDLGGRQELVIEVDFGDDLDIGDHADWADAHLVRKS